MDVLTGIALAAPAGLNAYIPLLAVAAADRLGVITLGQPYNLLSEWWMIAVLTVLLIVEFVADKVPAVDTVNDAVQTLVRPAAGGLLAVSAAGGAEVPPAVLVVIGVLLAGSVHAAKASARPAVNASTGGAGGPIASLTEDVGSVFLSVLAFVAPLLAVILVVAVLAFVAWAVLRFRRRRTGG
jgi:hypothetical protein